MTCASRWLPRRTGGGPSQPPAQPGGSGSLASTWVGGQWQMAPAAGPSHSFLTVFSSVTAFFCTGTLTFQKFLSGHCSFRGDLRYHLFWINGWDLKRTFAFTKNLLPYQRRSLLKQSGLTQFFRKQGILHLTPFCFMKGFVGVLYGQIAGKTCVSLIFLCLVYLLNFNCLNAKLTILTIFQCAIRWH